MKFLNRPHSYLCVFALAAAWFCSELGAYATVTMTGNAVTNAKTSDGLTNLPIGNLYLLIVDSTGDGFGSSATSTVPGGTNLNVGSSFGGDEILFRGNATLAGRTTINLTNLNQASYANRAFAVVWFDSLTNQTTAADGDKYGFSSNPLGGAQPGDWIIPSTDGAFGFSTTLSTSNIFLTNTAPGSATLVVGVPEPARLSLVGLAIAGATLRRRRTLAIA